ncbi:reverse transcriptase [Gossypium australe]|uniref:Reverse transcriptase n=1 Tax=Gossypium australe TaxID=47621 RepID=A0A5B6WK75_9ROSI|nr:reverse transcriptase [Gossypium australe]
MVFFIETKIDDKRMERIRRRCGFVNGIDVGVEGSRGGLCVAWRENFKRFTGFYGSPYASDLNASWNLLRTLGREQRYLWLVSGNFNEIMYSFEKSGGQPREERKMAAFREVLDECQLLDMGFQGTWFTWERGNLPETIIKERLDMGGQRKII